MEGPLCRVESMTDPSQVHFSAMELLDYASLAECTREFPRVVVALSGGADSVAMISALQQVAPGLNIQLAAVHANHATRLEADGDEAFVRELCGKLGIELYTEWRQGSGTERRASEAKLRAFRYAVYQNAVKHFGASVIALGHTADDLAETLLMNLLRGTGLGAYRFQFRSTSSGLTLLRPLWKTPRAAITTYLHAHGIQFRNDPSNESTAYTRNRVRHVLLPLVEKEFNPKARAALVRSAGVLGTAYDLVQELARKELARCKRRQKSAQILPRNWLLRQHEAKATEMIRQWLEHCLPLNAFLSHDKIRECYDALKQGAVVVVQLPGGRFAATGRALWWGARSSVADKAPTAEEVARAHARTFGFPLAKLQTPVILEAQTVRVATFSGETEVSGNVEGLVLRNRRPGDRLASGAKLKDVLQGDKVPFYLRAFLLVIARPEGDIVHVVGLPRVNGRMGAGFGGSRADIQFVHMSRDDNSHREGT